MIDLRKLCGFTAAALMLAAAAPAAHAAQAAGKSVQAQLQQALDILAIQQLLGDYTVQIDAKDWGAYSALFADDGELIFSSARAKGPAAIMKTMQGAGPPSAAGRAPPEMKHLCTNIVIHVEGDHATAHSRWTALAADADGKIRVGGAGVYEDQLVRQRGQWKFQRRVVYGDFPFRDPLAPK
jgi:ketosteroid isomerase-like protein